MLTPRPIQDNYKLGTKGHYMPRESFLYLRKYERMIEKITPPYWAIPPDRFIRLYPRLTNLTPTMTQTLRKCPQITVSSIMEVTNDHTRTRWNRRGIRPELAGTQTTDHHGQKWTALEKIRDTPAK